MYKVRLLLILGVETAVEFDFKDELQKTQSKMNESLANMSIKMEDALEKMDCKMDDVLAKMNSITEFINKRGNNEVYKRGV